MRHDESFEAGSYVLEIRSGLYQGVAQNLSEGRHVLGSGGDADLVLVEPGLAPLHVGLVLGQGTVRVEGLADGIAVADVGPVPAGSARTVRLPATFTVGDVVFSCRTDEAAAGETAPVASPTRSVGHLRALLGRPAVPGIAAAGLLAVTVFLTIANPIAGAAVLLDGSARHAPSSTAAPAAIGDQALLLQPSQPGQPASAFQPAAPPAGKDVQPARPPSRKTAVETASEALREAVAQAGLLNVHVTVEGGAVTATGSIEPKMTSRWEALQKGFDERFAGDVTLVNSVVAKAEKLPASLGIEGVWRGAQPYILIRGQRYLVGAVVDGGWTIRDIERDRVMLEREGRLVAMRF